MSSISEIVALTITRETSTVPQAGFGVALILSHDVNTDARVEFFTTAAAAKAKLFSADALTTAMIDDIFAQNPSVERIALGACRSGKSTVFTGDMTAGTIIGYVNGTAYSQAFTVDMDTTMAALLVLMEADASVDAAGSSYTAGTNTMLIDPIADTTIGVSYDISAATSISAQTHSTVAEADAYSDDLDQIVIYDNTWYGLLLADRTLADQEDVAAWTETNKKFFICASADANIVDQAKLTDTTTIAYYAWSQALDRTAVIYHTLAATQAADAALFGKILPQDPGTYTAMFKTLASVTVDSLTATQSTNALAKYANVYELIGGKNIVREGKVGSNEYIDVIIFIDWLEARIQEEVYSMLTRSLKVPYTEGGIAAIASAIDVPLQVGQNRGGISPEAYDEDDNQIGGYFITVPTFSTISSTDKANRHLDNVAFTAYLSGAIHKVSIDGVVTL